MGYILALSLILRLVYINQSLWLDEAIEALALMGRQGPLLTYALADYQPPLYHLIGYVTTHIFGFSEIVLRLPSLISGIFTVYFVIKIGQLIGNKKIGVIAGLLAAINPLLIYYSQEGRTYAMTTFFVTASFYYFLQLLSTKVWRLSSGVYYFIFTMLFLWTSYLSWFLLLAEGVYVLWKKSYNILLLQIISALTLILWLPSFIGSLGIGKYTLGLSSAWGDVVGGLTWKSLPLTWVKFTIGRISFDNKLVYGVIVLVLFVLHAYILKRVKWSKHSSLLLWLVPPIIFGLLTAWVLPVYSYFRVLFVLPAYLILLAIGMERMPTKFVSSLIVFQLVCLSYFYFTPRYRHEDWRTLSRELSQDPISLIALPSHEQNSGLLYYGIEEKRIFEPKNSAITGNRVYYIRYAEELFDAQLQGKANFATSGYTIVKQRVYPGIQLDIYENSH